MALQFVVLAIVAFISSTSAQWQEQSRPTTCGNCACIDQYKPYCGIDGRREKTYGNLCQLECAQKCSPGLRVKFEGVCSEPYRDSKTFGGNSGSWGAGSASYVTTRRTYSPTTTRRTYVPTSTRRPTSYGPGAGYGPAIQPTDRPYGSQQWETIRPTQRATTLPWWQSQQSSYNNNNNYNNNPSSSAYGNWRQGRDVEEDQEDE